MCVWERAILQWTKTKQKLHTDIISFMKCDKILYIVLLLLHLFATVLIQLF